MTMKKEIFDLIKSERGTCRLNNYSYLYRWTKSGMGKDVDELVIEFEHLNGIEYTVSRPIESRDYEGIIEECQQATDEYFAYVAEKIKNNLRAGYR